MRQSHWSPLRQVFAPTLRKYSLQLSVPPNLRSFKVWLMMVDEVPGVYGK